MQETLLGCYAVQHFFSAISNPVIHMDYDQVQVKVQWNNRRLMNAKRGTRGAKGKGVKNHGTLFLFTQ